MIDYDRTPPVGWGGSWLNEIGKHLTDLDTRMDEIEIESGKEALGVAIKDEGDLYTATNVEGALQEIAGAGRLTTETVHGAYESADAAQETADDALELADKAIQGENKATVVRHGQVTLADGTKAVTFTDLGYATGMENTAYSVAATLVDAEDLEGKTLTITSKATSGFAINCSDETSTDKVDLIIVGVAA